MNEEVPTINAVLVVRAKNSNFNADFDGNPRTLPDGTIFATDKALKYCIREYLSEFKGLPVFVRRERKLLQRDKKKDGKKLTYLTLKENFIEKAKKIGKELKDIPTDEGEILDILKSFIDIRMFGVVFSAKKGSNISLTGPIQISYGINKLEDSSIYVSQILSPYKNSNSKNEDSQQTTIGEETRADEVYYVYNISINPANAKQTGLNLEDIKLFKEALIKSVDLITSSTKYGTESVALVWIENKNNEIMNNMDDFIKICKDGTKVKMKLDKKIFGDKLPKRDFREPDKNNTKEIVYKKEKIAIEYYE